MPMLAYGLGRLFQLDEAAMFGVVIVGCVPGAMASNVLTLAARGNVTYSVCLTTSATLLSPLLVPLALYLAFGALDYEFPAGQTAGQLAFFVVLPVGAGHLMARLRGGGSQRTRWIASTTANLGILWIIAVVVAANRDKLLEVQPRTLMALMAINLLGYAAGYGGAMLMRLPIPMRRALTLEVGMQNAGLGTTLAMGLFGAVTEAAIPTAIYTFGCMFTGTVLANVWSGISSTVASKDGEPQRETA
jgi:BASS family bile acid:Na+ symporter